MEYSVVRYKSPLSETDHIFIPEINFHCDAPAPSGKYKTVELPCPNCLDITLFFVIETKKGNKLFNYGTKFLSIFCTNCNYSGEFSFADKDKDPWKRLSKIDLYRTSLDFAEGLNDSDRDKMIRNLKNRHNI